MSDIPVDLSAGAEATIDSDPFDSMEQEIGDLLSPPDEEITVKRGQLQKHAKELKEYRQKYGGYRKAFGPDAVDDDVQALGQFYQALKSGNPDSIKAAQAWIGDIFTGLTPAEEKKVLADVKEEAAESGETVEQVAKQLTPEDIERILDERLTAREKQANEHAEVQKNVKLLQDTASKLADEFGIPQLGKPGSPLYVTLMQATDAQRRAGVTDIGQAMSTAATELIQEIQSAQAASLARKKATAGAGAKPAPRGGTEPVGQTNKPKTLDEAHARWKQRMAAEVG